MSKTIEEIRESVESLSIKTTPNGTILILKEVLTGIADKLEELEGPGE